MRESAVEGVLKVEIEELGGMALKLMPTHAGVPDRLVLLPGGRHYLVELKQKSAHPSKIQRWWHEKADKIGHPVVVLRGAEEVRQWTATLTED